MSEEKVAIAKVEVQRLIDAGFIREATYTKMASECGDG
jgi:hypothetical protein